MGFALRARLPWLVLWGLPLSVLLAAPPVARATSSATTQCLVNSLNSLLSGVQEPRVSLEKLASEIATRRARVPEFQFIREEAQRRGLRVWLFGGTAAGYGHYVKWDVLRELGDTRFQPNRFDYDYTNIYRSTQDLDIVVDGSAQDAQAFEQALKTQFPYFLGSKAAGWEVRSIKDAHGDKGGLLGDFGFMNQHTDSNSTGMVELTDPPAGQSVVRDIRDFDNNKDPAFLKDVDEGRLTFYHSPKHTETPRFQSGQNPPIFSVVRALTKAFQYDLKISGEDLAILQREIDQFDPRRDLGNADATRWIEKNGKKLFQHAVDLEYAWNTLEKLGLRKKLISIQNNPQTVDSLAWWMSKEPFRGKPIGEGTGRTAESLGMRTVAHETKDFLAYESITRSHTGAPNAFLSRQNATEELAASGEGFYTAVGKKGGRGTGITIRFDVDPKAREGTDFVVVDVAYPGKGGEGDYVLWRNRNAIRVIPESLDMSLLGYFEFLAEGKAIGQDDQALLWKLKRRLDHLITSVRIPKSDMEKIRSIVISQIKNNAPNRDMVIEEWLKLEGARLKKSPQEVELLIDGLKTKSYQVDPAPLFAGLTELSRGTDLEPYVTQEWLPSILKTLKPDIGERALEHCLLSKDPQVGPMLQEFGAKALAEREAKNSSAFVRALKSIMKSIQIQGGDAKIWLKSETETTEQVQEKATYLAMHPELRQTLSEAELSRLESAFEKASNLSVFEKLAGGRLPPEVEKEVKSESFEFKSFEFPAGGKKVKLGSPANRHKVLLTKPFEMQATPVTQLQWSLVMGKNPSNFKKGGKMVKINGPDGMKDVEMNPNRPVEQVSWDDVQTFIERLNAADPKYNYRLPTEAEWEYAQLAGTDTAYSYGSDPKELGAYGWHNANSGNKTHEVASLKPNANGLYDMHGNVWEWMQDWWNPSRLHGNAWERMQNWWDPSRTPYAVDPTGPMTGSGHVLLGGSWANNPQDLGSAQRTHEGPVYRYSHFGFRLVRTPK
jgi:formylglycine-generating enzyme required for sulfatase activity